MRSFVRLFLLALVLVVVALVSALTAMRFAIHGREVNVPDLLGKTPYEARRLGETDGLQVETERQYYSATVPEGRILSQVPVAGTQVRRGWQVRVAESLGPQRVAIPNVVGQSERAAELNIQRRSLDVGTIAMIALPGSTPDEVLSQSPVPNASGISVPKISLLVAQAPPTPAFVMPNFVGQTLGSVTTALQDAGIRLGKVSAASPQPNNSALGIAVGLASASPLASSVVVSQNPVPGQKIIAGASVDLQVR
jgi:beta-lactam-binding protein with PASTA domain